MTIPVNRLKVMAFSFGAMVAALGRHAVRGPAVDASSRRTSAPDVLILIYACLVLGGVGSIAGAILGGILVTVAEQMLSSPTDSALPVLRADPARR